MSWLNNLKIGRKIIVGFAFLIIASSISSVVGIIRIVFKLKDMGEQTEVIKGILGMNTGVLNEIASISLSSMRLTLVITIVIAVFIAIYFVKNLSKPMNQVTEHLNEIANGDLTKDISKSNLKRKDEFGELAQALKRMQDNMNEVISNINTAATQVAAGSNQVSDSSTSLSQGATEQSSSIEKLTVSMEKIASQTKHNAQSANEAKGISEEAKKNAATGTVQMKNMLASMNEINESSNHISKIIKVIDDIAFQTNILALNAAVEAARAGEHGKGFAVVAEEVRNLAARSANAAKETTEMIEGSINKVEHGTKIANVTSDALAQIVDGISKITNLVGNIASASNEQAIGAGQVNVGISQIADAIQITSATSEETASASEELSGQALMLKEQVRTFKLKNTKQTFSHEKVNGLNPEVIKMLENMNENEHKKIALNDMEFSKY